MKAIGQQHLCSLLWAFHKLAQVLNRSTAPDALERNEYFAIGNGSGNLHLVLAAADAMHDYRHR